MSEEYKDYLAWCILISFAVIITLVSIWVAGWLLPIVLGTLGAIYAGVWALERIFGD